MALISDYGLLADCQGAALVSREGSIDWWCPARFDAPSVFSRLLDPAAGHWSIRPTGQFSTTRRYLPATMVIETEFTCGDGTARLTDALLLGEGERGHQIGYGSPHVLVRELEVLSGRVDVEFELAPRMEYGLVTPRITETDAGIDIAAAADRLKLSPHPALRIDVPGARVRANFTLGQGERVTFTLQHRASTARLDGEVSGSLHDTAEAWQSWSDEHQGYRGPYREQVHRSGMVLQALTYQPSGAVVAAATTSLPEELGGTANWDYRFGWLRDSSFTLKALWVAACPDEAERLFDWMASSSGAVSTGHLPIMFGVAGEHDLSERELPHLRGYAESRPVRVGNNAWKQKQLDVFGEVLECAWVLRDQLGEHSPEVAAFLRSLADRAAAMWRQTDAGIWEGREGERHYVTSKLMCWVALDRAVRLADSIIAGPGDVQRWEEAREAVRAAVLDEGWNASVGAFAGAFGSDHLDAGVLLMPLFGFLPADDERVVATITAIERELGEGVLVQRWTGAGDEGAFVICSYWLAEAWALAGNPARARSIFDTITAHANDLGLLAEEVDLRDGSQLGNFPQALSHIGLVNAAWAIAQAEQAIDD